MAKVFTITAGLENMGALKTGGQGSVYKAKRIGEIITAVKLLPTPIHAETEDDKNFLSFQNEVEKLKKVNEQPNPHIVKILNSGLTESGNLPFIEMEFIEGPDMEDLLKPPYDPIFPIKEIIKVADQLSYALSHCHKVDVKHGDIKSNNVKFNVNTGNYVLLDFGLAIMSEEQRRTSMRQAGAIEFMAPEQNEGMMYFQTDVYSYGIILFELLTGNVPYPLTDKGETARNRVMVGHMEVPVPDILSHRRAMLPLHWTEEKKEREMQVPRWLTATIHKCLEKLPANRFKDGSELHRYIVHNSTLGSGGPETGAQNASILQSENERLRTLVIQYQEALKLRDSLPVNPHKVLSLNEVLSNQTVEGGPEGGENIQPVTRRASIAGAFILLAVLLGAAAFAYKFRDKLGLFKQPKSITKKKPVAAPVRRYALFQVKVPKAFFHNTPDEATRRTAYMVKSTDTVTALNETDDFIYTEFYNRKKQLSKGWLLKTDLEQLDGFTSTNKPRPGIEPEQPAVKDELERAAGLTQVGDYAAAASLYGRLAGEGIGEAMFQYGDLALRGRNDEINCLEGLEWLKKAAAKNVTQAKTALGFLYSFAGNDALLIENNYIPCPFDEDIARGTKYLVEAIADGDTTALRFLQQ